MNIKIMVAAHKEVEVPKDRQLYLPVFVGSALHDKIPKGFQPDNIGENISKKNPNFNELTAMYWAWKNLDVDVIGLVHYRRLLSLHKQRNLTKILNKKEIESLLKNVPIILPRKRKYYVETNYSHYVHAHRSEALIIAKDAIKRMHPKYIDSFDKVMNSRSAHMFNMFVMRKKYFNAYAEWLFSILFEIENKIDISNYSVQEARVFGYVSELLLDVWIDGNKIQYKDVNWVQLGKRNNLLKMAYFIGRKAGILDKTHF